MTTNQLKCPRCGSTKIREESDYAHRKPEGQPAQKNSFKSPNYCLECKNEWFNNEAPMNL